VVMVRKPRAVPACPMGGRKALGNGHDNRLSERAGVCGPRALEFLEPITITTCSSRALRKRCFR
jgi:hypothetical protein